MASPAFAGSKRRAQLLQYLVRRTLAGEADQVNEYAIGVDVFAKPTSFDPRLESVVRNEVMRLRQKLIGYYENEGSGDPITIAIPKRSYAVVFNPREQANPGRVRKWLAYALIGVVGLITPALIVKRTRGVNASRQMAKTESEDLYLKGRYYWEKRSAESLPKAIGYFTQAVVRDPQYAKAYVGLADSYNLLPEFSSIPASEAYPPALDSARRAVQLDDSSAEAHASLGFALAYGQWNFRRAESEFRRATTLDPHYVPAHHWLATMLMSLGRASEAYEEIEEARRRDPASNAILADKGLILLSWGRQDEAFALLRQIQAEEPTFPSTYRYLAEGFLRDRDYGDYFEECRSLALLLNDRTALRVTDEEAKAYAVSGVAGMLKTQEALYREGSVSAYLVAEASALDNKKSEALEFLGKSLNKREPSLVSVGTNTAFSALRGEQQFESIVNSVFGGIAVRSTAVK